GPRPNIQHPTSNIQHRTSNTQDPRRETQDARPKTRDPTCNIEHRTWEGSCRETLENDQVVPVHDLDPVELPRADFGRAEIGDAAGELGAVEVAYPDDFAGRKV